MLGARERKQKNENIPDVMESFHIVFTASLLIENGFHCTFCKIMIEKYQLEPVVVFV